MIFTGGYIHNRGTTVFIPGGHTLIMSRKVTLIGPNSDRDIEGALRRRFPDLAQDNFGIGLVHSSYYLVEPVAHGGWSVHLVIPVEEDDDTPVVLFKAVLSTYEGLGAIYSTSPQQVYLDNGHGPRHCLWASGRTVCLLPQWSSVGP